MRLPDATRQEMFYQMKEHRLLNSQETIRRVLISQFFVLVNTFMIVADIFCVL